MERPGTAARPLRVAIIGAGPTGFYAADQVLRQEGLVVEVDMFDRVPMPFGLVRSGVAPDHQKIKSVIAAFDKVASHPRFRFYGCVELGKHVTVEDLRAHYHQIFYATGAQTDRRMGIPGEDLKGSHPATEFVAWYNGHPDYQDHQFDLGVERAAVVGVGNVAIDVARILCRTPEELATTDISDQAFEALRMSALKEIYLLGRRGPAQAAFTNPEIKELGELTGADVVIDPREVELDPLSRAALAKAPDRATTKKVDILQSFAGKPPTGKPRQLKIRFLVSPVELIGNAAGEVTAIKLVRNELYETPTGTLQPRAIDQFETLPVGLVFRSVGYRGVPLPGVPFNDKWGVILNERGRVLDPNTKQPVVGEYTGGWIKRGPSGVIGTNKPDAAETVTCMLEDLAKGTILTPAAPDAAAADALVRSRQPQCLSYDDWRYLDRIEVERGRALGRPRVKFTRLDDILAALRERDGAGNH
ncbi:MAG TPA: FAD-dependent oxidoreductase [Methylomirabilota bacterium]|nr:FAD-dependent oxidoreductase [Methylomirabilota bacterium]